MSTTSRRGFVAASLAGTLAAGVPSAAAQPAFDQTRALVGRWELVSAKAERSDGAVTDLYGPSPIGFIRYDSAGYMEVMLGRPDRPRFASGDQRRGTDTEVRAAYENLVAFAGRYRIEDGGRIVHDVAIATLPNWQDGQQLRLFEVVAGQRGAPDELRLSSAPLPFGGGTIVARTVWRRQH